MLSLDQIISHYPQYLHPYQKSILREYLQYQILAIIFSSQFGSKIAFLGGTALRIIWNNQRFSEDLDFDNLNLSREEFLALGDLIKREMELRGFLIETTAKTDKGYRLKIRLPRLLHDFKLSPLTQEKILIHLDITPQNFPYHTESNLIDKFGFRVHINCVPKDILLAQKLYAAFNRPRTQGRDFFDITFLYSLATLPNMQYLRQKMNIANSSELKIYVLQKIKDLNFKELADDAMPFLFDTESVHRIIEFREFAQQIL